MSFSLTDVIRSFFGVDVTPKENPITDTVGTSSVKIAGNNPKRMSLTIFNLSANTVYIGLKPDVSATKGILLSANGGNATVQWDKDFQMVSHEWFAVASGANSAIYVLENNIYQGY